MITELINIFTAIANAIRNRTGGSKTYLPSEMAAAILAIETKEDAVYQEKTATPSTSSQTVTPDSGYDGLSKVTVSAVQTAEQATPAISVNTAGLITASAAQEEGYVSAGTKTATQQLNTQAAKTVTPSTSQQTAVASNVFTTGAVTVGAIPSQYIVPSGSVNIVENGTVDVTQYASAVVAVESSGATIATATKTQSLNSTSISFDVASLPKSFHCMVDTEMSLSSTRYIMSVMSDGESTHGVWGYGSSKTYRCYHSNSYYTWTYSNGVLTITSSSSTNGGYFRGGYSYRLIYAY